MKEHQGKYHLLVILFLPTILVAACVVKSLILTLTLLFLLVGVVIALFSTKESKTHL